MSTIVKFDDDVIEHKENDIEKIQTKPSMYIGQLGTKAALHLSKEEINNMIDECINPNSPGDQIDIFLDEVDNVLMVSDNGRGIPFDKMELVSTKLQAGSKFTREGSGASAGENGVGKTAVNALSEFYENISHRYGEKASIRFERGKIAQYLTIKKDKADSHGTTVRFKPSPYYLGDDCEISREGLIDWLEKIIYLVPNNIRVKLDVNCKGKEAAIHKKYQNKDGLKTLTSKLVKKPILDPIHFTKSIRLSEYDKGREIDRFVGLEAAFTFNSNPGELVVESFCNFVNTVDHGVHVDGVRTGITQYLTKQTKESLSERDAKKLDITPQDVLTGLVLTVYLSTDMQPQFGGQTKEKMTSANFFQPLRNMTYNAMVEYFKQNPKELKKVTDYVKTNARARIESTKVRNSVVRGETSILDIHSMKNYTPPNDRTKGAYREVLLIEGDSAGGSAKQGRYSNDFQGIFSMRGVPLNSYGLTLDKVLLNEEFKMLVVALECNIGERFDIDKLFFTKIIIMTDSDVDGYRIFSLICVFFLVHLPEIVKRGLLYKAVAPLYKIKDKKRPFVLNMAEFIEVFEERVTESIRLIDTKTNVVMKHKDIRDFLMKNRSYLEELHRAANYYAVRPELVEFVAIMGKDIDMEPSRKLFIKAMGTQFPELKLDSDNVITGIIEGKYQILTLDHIFEKRIATIRSYIFNVNEGNFIYTVHEKQGSGYTDKGNMTIGSLLALCQKFQPVIVDRYKGLGELEPDELKETTLDPNNRILIQLTLKDLEKELEKFKILHGDSVEARKDLMRHFKIDREDLDN